MPSHPESLILVYPGDSGLRAMMLDVLKKAVGREDCALCEITYSPLGKRSAWRQCERRLELPVSELHRDQLPVEWRITSAELPCVLVRAGESPPSVLVARDQIATCRGNVAALEACIRAALSAREHRETI